MIERRVNRFLREPLSVRNAVNVIVVGSATVCGLGALLMRILDHEEYPHFGRGLWWAVQTVATVGYGDVTPARTSGRIVATAVMLWGVAFVAILTAAITSTFVARAARETNMFQPEPDEKVEASLEDLAARLDRIEQLLREGRAPA